MRSARSISPPVSMRSSRTAQRSTSADWILPAEPGEFWWPRGGSLREVLAAIPAEYDVVQALVRPFVDVRARRRPRAALTYRLSAQALLDDPAGSPRPARRLAHRCGVDVSGYDGAIPKAASPAARLVPDRSPRGRARGRVPQTAIDKASRTGRSRRTPASATPWQASATAASIEFPRPTVAENAWFAVDAAVLGESDAFGIRDDIDLLEQRLAELERTSVSASSASCARSCAGARGRREGRRRR